MLGLPRERRAYAATMLAAILELDVRLQQTDAPEPAADEVRDTSRAEAQQMIDELAELGDDEGVVPHDARIYIKKHSGDDPRIYLGELMVAGLGEDYPGARTITHQALLALQLASAPAA